MSGTMRAVVYPRGGSPEALVLRDVPRPAPREREVLVRVRAAGVNALDYRRFSGKLQQGSPPQGAAASGAAGKVLGADVAGVVEAVGARATRFKVGDAVFGVTTGSSGGFAEYARAAEDRLAPKPPQVSFEAAAAVPIAGLTALQALRDRGRVQTGQRVLVHGASGGVGTFAVQLARAFGAEVTAVTSARNAAQALALGAVRALDYAREDFAQAADRYDLVVVVNGARSLFDYRRALGPGGRCIVIGGSVGQIAQAVFLGPLVSLFGGRSVGFMGIARTRAADLATLAELLASGRLVPTMDRSYPLPAAAEALRYLAQGHATGKVVLTVPE